MNDTKLDRLLADASPYTDTEVCALQFSRGDAELLGEVVGAQLAGSDELELELAADTRSRNWPGSARVITVAATAALVVTGFAVWRVNGTDSSSGSAATVADTSAPVSNTGLSWPPRILLDDSWTAVYADEDPTSGFGEIQFVRGMDGVSITWGPHTTPDPEIYGDGSGPMEERDVNVLGRVSLSIDESVVQTGTVPQTSRHRVIVPVDQGTIQIQVSVQRADILDGVLSSIQSVDIASWVAALPARTVTPAQRPGAVAQILAGVPLPDGFDTASLGASPVYSDRYQLVAYVISAAVCGWLDVWFTAKDNNESIGEHAAAEALATSREWPALVEIAPEGGFADVMWEHADAVNGDGMLPSGTRLDRLYAANTGCNRFWTDSLPPDASVP